MVVQEGKMRKPKASVRCERSLLTVIGTAILAVLAALALQTESAAAPPPQASHHSANQRSSYFGTLIGKLNGKRNSVSGDVYAVDEQTIFIKNFNYDGLAQDAYFWSSVISPLPAGQDGFIVPDEKGSTKPLERYQDKDVVLRLPEGKTLRETNWLSIYSRKLQINLGDILFNKATIVLPRPLEIAPLSQLAHDVRSGPITIVDAQTFLIPDLHYDGLGPAGYFWLTRGGSGLSQNGLRLKDENGSSGPLKKYSGETVVISLPDDLTIYDFDYFGIWCKEFQVNFGQTRIPQQAKVPPSPKMLGIKPENKLNCEILYDDLGYEIRWVLDGDDIVMQLVGKIDSNEYMAFGLGKDDSKSDMQNADAVVTWVDRVSGQVHAIDYFLGGKQQCVNNQSAASSCPDVKLSGGGDSLTLLHGAIVNGYSMVTFKRPQLGIDELYDQHVYSDGQQSVIWAIGTLNAAREIGYHRLRTRGNMFIDFARNPQWNCPIPDLNATMHGGTAGSPASLPAINSAASQVDPVEATPEESPSPRQAPASVRAQQLQQAKPAAFEENSPITSTQQPVWFIPQIVCPKDKTFYVQIGPTGAKKGYEGLTGRQSFGGISWYVNGLMIPELVMERGSTYRFVVEGGNDKTSATRRHPFYLTDSQEGGFDFKLDDERLKERIFAGVALRGDGQFVPTAEGRLCEWKQTNQTSPQPDNYTTFSSYQKTLKLECLPGQASMLKFAPDSQTPDLLYYQCYTHRYMGWKIRVVNSCSAYRNSSTNNKRDLSSTQGAGQDGAKLVRSTYDRRSLKDQSDLMMKSSEPRMIFEQPIEFADEPSASSNYMNNNYPDMFATGQQLPSDMIILNNSQLLNNNLSGVSFDDLMKLSPADLEFIDQQSLVPELQQAAFGSYKQQSPQATTTFHHAIPIPLQNNLQQTRLASIKSNKTSTAKTPKTLHSYMRRLAAMYYPVQKQLTSILPGQNVAKVNSQGQQQQVLQPEVTAAATSNTNHHFSLANLVPISKIDLSKSTITKKLNKFRFKSGRKYEPKLSHPPTPANEFNYDIFNNQLAQLKKHQKEFEAVHSMISNEPQTSSSNSFDYLPMVMNDNSEGQQLVDSMNYQASHQVLNNMINQHMKATNNFMHQNTGSPIRLMPPQPPQQQLIRPPLRFNEVALGPPNQLGEQPYLVEYSSMNSNLTKEPPRILNQNRPPPPPSMPNDEQHSVFITRLPQGYQYFPSRQPERPAAVWPPNKFAGARPYPTNNQQHLHQRGQILESPSAVSYREHGANSNQMSSLPSITLSIHDNNDNINHQAEPQAQQQEGIQNVHHEDSLSLSGSGAYYDFRQQPTIKEQQQVDSQDQGQQDHMLAIERFSKQSSERRPPSIVHPITGEPLNAYNNETSLPGAKRYSSLLIDKNIVAPSENSISQHSELMDVDQSIQLNDLQRLQQSNDTISKQYKTMKNFINGTHQVMCGSEAGCRGESAASQPTTTESIPANLVKPSQLDVSHQMGFNSLPAMTTQSSIGPLTPSLGPPIMAPSTTSSSLIDDENYMAKSTLLEHQAPYQQNNLLHLHQLNKINFDPTPFTPIELIQANELLDSRQMFRAPSLIESMISQQQSPFRPEPPVQVASYLAQQLSAVAQNPPSYSQTSEKSTSLMQDNKNQAQLKEPVQQASQNSSKPTASDLIILKPAIAFKQNPQTYVLKPEFLTNQFKLMGDSSIASGQDQAYNQPMGGNSHSNDPSNRPPVGGHLFDRLSSLSSPPSTSIALMQMMQQQQDPMQASNTNLQIQKELSIQASNSSATNSSANSSVVSDPNKHRKFSLPLAGPKVAAELAEQAETIRVAPGGDNINNFNLYKDNQTDNAILSHVMSLISSNAIPTPPIIPSSSYSSVDYFMPIGSTSDSRPKIYQRSLRG